MLSQADKKRLVQQARTAVVEYFPDLADREVMAGACLYGAFFMLKTLHEAGLRPCPQAGNMSWPLGVPDDGVSVTHWSYVWSPGCPLSQLSMSMGNLPEMHVWVGIVETQEIIDIQVGLLPEICPFGWPVPPPDFFWGTYQDLPEGTVYYSNEAATKYAWAVMEKHLVPRLR